jgi:hypothetical protein
MAVNPNYHEETVPAESAEEEQVIANLTTQGWKLYARPDDVGKPGYVRLMFWKPDPIVPHWLSMRS